MSRGIRNNNPGNIRWGDKWKGLKENGKEQDDSFCVFIKPEYGIRALAKILRNYRVLHKITTVAGIIHRFAPPSENNTVAYINHVAEVLKVDTDDTIDVRDNNTMLKLIKAIILHENGEQPYTDKQILEGIKMV
jgi:hypothetical protein